VPVYNFSICSDDGDNWEVLGCTDLADDYAALAFGSDVIRDMLRGNSDQHAGWRMDITESGRAACSIAFPVFSEDRLRA
jgi:hypothetical protein